MKEDRVREMNFEGDKPKNRESELSEGQCLSIGSRFAQRKVTDLKDSGIPWIGEIPKDWEVAQVRNLFKITRGRVIAATEMNEKGLYPVYSSQTENNGCMGYIDTFDYEGEAITWTTDGAKAGSVFYRNGQFNCTNICGILQKKEEREENIHFFTYAIGYSADINKRPDINGFKIMSNEMASIKIVYPPLIEQKAIAEFLDRKCGEIDELVALQDKMIEELKAYKQSIITETVTKGLNPNVPLKDSGIEWIGEIPQHWKIDKTIRLFDKIGSGTTPKSMDEANFYGTINWIQSGDINGGILTRCKNQISEKTLEEYSALKVFKSPFIIIAMYGASVGNTSLSMIDGSVNQACCVLSNGKMNKDYSFLVIKSCKDYWLKKAVGGGQPNISQDTIKSTWLPLPPLSEQQEIADFLDKKCSEIDSLIKLKQKKKDTLKDYKKSIIYEYVTGKKRNNFNHDL